MSIGLSVVTANCTTITTTYTTTTTTTTTYTTTTTTTVVTANCRLPSEEEQAEYCTYALVNTVNCTQY